MRLALFTLSLDPILGYAGIVSLGHAAFFGVGAYSAGLLALHGIIKRASRSRSARCGLVPRLALGFLPSFTVIRGDRLDPAMLVDARHRAAVEGRPRNVSPTSPAAPTGTSIRDAAGSLACSRSSCSASSASSTR